MKPLRLDLKGILAEFKELVWQKREINQSIVENLNCD